MILLKPTNLSFIYILIGMGLFLYNHYYSYKSNYKRDRNANKNIGKLMFQPYARIIPIHLTIIFGTILNKGLILFLIIKTIIDFLMHNSEQNNEPIST